MSGGSYNYLCYADSLGQLLEKRSELIQMRDRLSRMKDVEDALSETEELIAILNGTEKRIEARIKHLEPIWHAIEWVDSGDSIEEDLPKIFEKWRSK